MAEGNNPFAAAVTTDADDTQNPADDTAADNQPDDSAEDDQQQDRSGDDLDAMKSALKKANAEAAKFRKQLEAIADKDKTELQRATERAEKAERAAEAAATKALRLEVATSKGLSPALAARLQGATQEELEADADELLKITGASPTTSRRDPDQGRRDVSSPNDSADMSRWIRNAVKR